MSSEVELGLWREGVAGEGSAVAVADLDAVPVEEVGVALRVVAENASEGELGLHEFRGSAPSCLTEHAAA